jgi:short-subunit dehydrogenase
MRWLITGTSSGLGRALAIAARDAGHDVIATARALEHIAELDGVHHLELDLAAPNEVPGDVDVLVNNAGFGLLGAFEELTDAELREAFEVNLFGHLALTRAVLPGMRERRYGRIVQMSSVIGVTSGLGGTAYAGPKAALEAISTALAAEVKPFGIAVTIVQPGPFRTAFGGTNLRWAHPLPAYADRIGPPRAAFEATHGTQPNDPRKGAHAILAAVAQDDPPLHLPLGPEAFDWIAAHLQGRLDALEPVRALGSATAFEDDDRALRDLDHGSEC